MTFPEFFPLVAITTTPTGARHLLALAAQAELAEFTLWVPEKIADSLPAWQKPQVQFYTGSLRETLATLWPDCRAMVFAIATGAVVRLIVPLLQDKATDPAIVVLDEAGQFVISLVGGHQGGADQLAQAIALSLNRTPVLSGSANALGLPGIDLLGQPFGWRRGTGDWTAVSGAIARQQPVQVIQDAGSALWQHHLPATHSFGFESESERGMAAQVWITHRQQAARTIAPDIPQVWWHPRVLWVGIGCERGTPRQVIEAAIHQAFQSHHLAEAAIAGLATIDLKANEVGLLELREADNYPLWCFTPEQLATVEVPTPSPVVQAEVGTPSVAEAAALLAASQVTPDAAAKLLVSKLIFRQAGEPGAVTVAIAQSSVEYTGRDGALYLVGTGPGALSQLTPAAKTAINQADAVIGYSLYIDLIRPLLRPGQIVESMPITQERQRAERAIALAHWGLSVAVVSSGDCGIYGMAGLVLEMLQHQGWNGMTPAVQVVPGISALQSAAARVGAPLMHDFCAISLSNLLTPWEVIEQRLKAAAQADFVVALYNPKSRTRTEQIAIAQTIFLHHRRPSTPVAVVRAAYRDEEHITLTTLDKLLEVPIDMLTTVIIGNQSTSIHRNWMITPRGYLAQAQQNQG
jgi:cobalt-precorrin 5A hydrolase/precorrin-3B C17-methyltransferase